MKLQEGDRRTEFACLICFEKRWRKHPGQDGYVRTVQKIDTVRL